MPIFAFATHSCLPNQFRHQQTLSAREFKFILCVLFGQGRHAVKPTKSIAVTLIFPFISDQRARELYTNNIHLKMNKKQQKTATQSEHNH